MGPSGSGKSTLMHILAGLDKPTSGDVTIDGTNITTLNDADLTRLRRKHIGFVFQFFNLLADAERGGERRSCRSRSPARSRTRSSTRSLLSDIGLADRRKHRPSELSGGQQQRVAIARALVSRPTVVFADEPTGNLDTNTGGEILDLMRTSVDEYGQTMVIVTHEARAASYADRVLFLADGLIVRDIGRTSTQEVMRVLNELNLG